MEKLEAASVVAPADEAKTVKFAEQWAAEEGEGKSADSSPEQHSIWDWEIWVVPKNEVDKVLL